MGEKMKMFTSAPIMVALRLSRALIVNGYVGLRAAIEVNKNIYVYYAAVKLGF